MAKFESASIFQKVRCRLDSDRAPQLLGKQVMIPAIVIKGLISLLSKLLEL